LLRFVDIHHGKNGRKIAKVHGISAKKIKERIISDNLFGEILNYKDKISNDKNRYYRDCRYTSIGSKIEGYFIF
jgi:AAA+ superfamily predicted ATPase